MKSFVSLLHQLTPRHGIQYVYRDGSGNWRVVPDESLQEFFQLMGVSIHIPQQVQESALETKAS